jgi:hypothetical protein
MKVGHDQALHRAIQLLDDLRPGYAHGIIGKTGINDDPAITIAQQPQIDVVELKRQRHAQPENYRRATSISSPSAGGWAWG